ncbi:hypothetical protein N5V81_14135 [Escherichia coli]|nr:hypothetical protein [Escherichia coli]
MNEYDVERYVDAESVRWGLCNEPGTPHLTIVPLSQIDRQMRFEYNELKEIENDLAESQNVYSVFTEAQFRRQGLPLLSGMLDGTFNEETWTAYVGSPFTSLWTMLITANCCYHPCSVEHSAR